MTPRARTTFTTLLAAISATLAVACSAAPSQTSADGEVDQGESNDAISISRSKRDYCCFAKDGTGTVRSCRKIRDYRDELGRLSALNNCQSTFMGSDWENHQLVSASCSDRPECPPEPPKPPPAPTCSNGATEGATWTINRPGTRCETVTYECRNLQIVEIGSGQKPECTEL